MDVHFGIWPIIYISLFCLRRADEAGSMAEQMIGDYLKTKQTGEGGRICNKVSSFCSLLHRAAVPRAASKACL